MKHLPLTLRAAASGLLAGQGNILGLPVFRFGTLFLGALALIGGALYAIYLGDTLRYPDERIYVEMARNLLTNGVVSVDGITPTGMRAPGEAFFIAGLLAIFDSLTFVRFAHFALFAGSLMLLFNIVRQRGGDRAGLIAVLLVFCYPVVFYTTGTFYPQTLVTFLLLVVFWLLVTRDSGPAGHGAAGVAFGALILTSPLYVLSLPLWLATAWIHGRSWGRTMKLALFTVAALAVVTPWIVRNTNAFDRFVFVSANSGFMLLLGNSEATEPNIGPRADVSEYRAAAREAGGNEADQDAYLRSRAVEWILSNKAAALELYSLKVLNHFNYRNDLATASESSRLRDRVMFITYYGIAALALLHVIATRRRIGATEIFVCLLYIGFAFAQAIFFTRIRYRLPLDWFLIVFAALYVENLISRWQSRTAHETVIGVNVGTKALR